MAHNPLNVNSHCACKEERDTLLKQVAALVMAWPTSKLAAEMNKTRELAESMGLDYVLSEEEYAAYLEGR